MQIASLLCFVLYGLDQSTDINLWSAGDVHGVAPCPSRPLT
jgi:hypothetical protein